MKNANSKAKNITGTFLKKEPKKLYNYNSYKNEKAPYAEKDNSKGQGRRNFGQYYNINMQLSDYNKINRSGDNNFDHRRKSENILSRNNKDAPGRQNIIINESLSNISNIKYEKDALSHRDNHKRKRIMDNKINKEKDSKAFDNVSIYYSSYSNKKKNGLDDSINNPVSEKIGNNNGKSKDSSFYSFSSSIGNKKKSKSDDANGKNNLNIKIDNLDYKIKADKKDNKGKSNVLINDMRIERNPNKEKIGELANENKGRFEAIINEIKTERNMNNNIFNEMKTQFNNIFNEMKKDRNENKERFAAIINEMKTDRNENKGLLNNIISEMKTERTDIFKEMKKDRNENREKFDAIIKEMEAERKESSGRFDAIIEQMKAERELSKKQHDDLILQLKNKI